MPYQWQLKYYLARGKYYRHWQLRSIRNRNKEFYFLPVKSSILLSNCILANNRNIARKTHSGANRQPCAWVKAETWTEVEPVRDLGECEPLFYNPKIQPYWQDAEGNNIDGLQFETILTAGNRVYGIGKISRNLFDLKNNFSRPKLAFESKQINPLDTPES